MEFMLVTLDVSRVSGWLNADANCRVERRTYEKQGEARAGRWEGVGATAAQLRRKRCAGKGPTRGGAQGTHGAHPKHVHHACDVGRVKI